MRVNVDDHIFVKMIAGTHLHWVAVELAGVNPMRPNYEILRLLTQVVGGQRVGLGLLCANLSRRIATCTPG